MKNEEFNQMASLRATMGLRIFRRLRNENVNGFRAIVAAVQAVGMNASQEVGKADYNHPLYGRHMLDFLALVGLEVIVGMQMQSTDYGPEASPPFYFDGRQAVEDAARRGVFETPHCNIPPVIYGAPKFVSCDECDLDEPAKKSKPAKKAAKKKARR